MHHPAICDLIQGDAFQLYGQPKWTFGKKTCNTYEVFAEKILLEDGSDMPAWPVLELIERDEVLTQMFSNWFLKKAMASAVDLTRETDSNVTLSMNMLPLYANREEFVEEILQQLQETGLPGKRLQFEISEAQNLSPKGVENLNVLHDAHGVGLLLANFGRGYSNIDLLREVHFDGLELDRTFAAHVPQDDQTCRMIVAIQHFADALDLTVCVKGIEQHDQFEFFDELGCFKGQGFLIGKPMDLVSLKEYIEKYAIKRGHI